VVLSQGEDSQPWEGLQAVDSMQPYQLSDNSWAAFYGGVGEAAWCSWDTMLILEAVALIVHCLDFSNFGVLFYFILFYFIYFMFLFFCDAFALRVASRCFSFPTR
jgi:hypothetical protein